MNNEDTDFEWYFIQASKEEDRLKRIMHKAYLDYKQAKEVLSDMTNAFLNLGLNCRIDAVFDMKTQFIKRYKLWEEHCHKWNFTLNWSGIEEKAEMLKLIV